MAIDPALLLVGWPTILLVSVGKGAFGGGLALLGVPLLALVMSPVEAAVVVAPLVALMDVFAVGAYRPASWSWPDLLWLAPGLLAGIGLGTAVVALVDPRWVTLLIALVTLSFAAHYFLRGRRAEARAAPVSRGLALLAGTASGFATFVAHSGGPPVALYLLRRGLPKTVLAGTTVAFFALGNLLKLTSYLVLGQGYPGVFLIALALTPAVPVGLWIGRRLHDALPQATLFFWCYVILTLASAKLLVDALRSLGS